MTCNLIDAYVGKQIRIHRKVAGISQNTLAKGIGLTFQQVQKYEYGENRISCSKITQIANLLNTSILDFFPENEGELKARENVDVNKDAIKLMQNYIKLNEAQRKAVKNIINVMKNDE